MEPVRKQVVDPRRALRVAILRLNCRTPEIFEHVNVRFQLSSSNKWLTIRLNGMGNETRL
jgi:hypothetical protein